MDERLKDWLFRYQYLYPLRRTNKQKQRFLAALVTDIMKMRQDISVIEYKQNKKYVSSNLYVGDIETAERIICTYYDTPPQTIGAYELFDRKQQRQSVTAFILISVGISLLIGLGLTWGYMSLVTAPFDFRSISTLVAIAGYGLYFYLFSKVAKGLSNRRTIVRNTSSVLALLMLMDLNQPKTAYAFLDEGCFGELGLEALKASCGKSAKIYLLDSVGADAPLHVIGNHPLKASKQVTVHPAKAPITYIVGANVTKTAEGKRYFLRRSELRKLNTVNLKTVTALLQTNVQ